MSRGRWLAVAVSTIAVGLGSLLLDLMLSGEMQADSSSRYLPYVALGLYAVSPFLGAVLSGRSAALVAAARGLALGICATIAAAAIHPGSGAMPLALGVAIAGLVALSSTANAVWLRLVAVALVVAYALISERLISIVFAYPLLGLADEITDLITARRARAKRRETVSS